MNPDHHLHAMNSNVVPPHARRSSWRSRTLSHGPAHPLVAAMVAVAALALGIPSTHAFPPAPHQTLFGVVRDEQGNPLALPKSSVVLEVPGSPAVTATVRNTTGVDGNYQLTVPMDSGLTAARYKPSALFPAAAFTLKVRIGTVNYVPIEMTGVNGLVAEPGKTARVDLTLGVDSDGDGLPDAWERMLLAAMGRNGTLKDVRPDADDDGDGISNLKEYLAGTYAFDPADGFVVTAKGVENGRSVLEFLALRGRTYTVEASADMSGWKPVGFAMPGDAANAAERTEFLADDVKPVQVRVAQGAAAEDRRFFRVKVH